MTFFAAYWSDYLRGSVGLVARLRLWMRDGGLTLAEVTAVMRRLMLPENAAKIESQWKLHAELARLVDEAVKERRSREAMVARRGDGPDAAERTKALSILRGIGTGTPEAT